MKSGKHFAVIGAGITGCSAALELARQGHRVTVLESGGKVGGKVLSYCCKATDSCSRCGVCVAHARISEAVSHPNIHFLTGATVSGVEAADSRLTVKGRASNPHIAYAKCTDCGACVEACPARCISRYSRGGLTEYLIDYSACLLSKGMRCGACADACPAEAVSSGAASAAFRIPADGALVAIGHVAFDPTVKPRLGYGRIPGVMTGLEAEERLSGHASLADGKSARVAFIQCVGSRDPKLGRNFCSAVCCAYSLRMARLLKSRQPDAEITVYYIDIQNFDKAFTPFRAELEAKGVRLVRGIPSSVSRTAQGGLSLLTENPEGGETTALHDAVVLSVGLCPAAENGKVAELFHLEKDENGFLRSDRPNVRVAGTCREPQGIVDAIASARAAAWEMGKS
jgi:heterodisulfide reductase subunit A-like polyferredoxin